MAVCCCVTQKGPARQPAPQQKAVPECHRPAAGVGRQRGEGERLARHASTVCQHRPTASAKPWAPHRPPMCHPPSTPAPPPPRLRLRRPFWIERQPMALRVHPCPHRAGSTGGERRSWLDKKAKACQATPSGWTRFALASLSACCLHRGSLILISFALLRLSLPRFPPSTVFAVAATGPGFWPSLTTTAARIPRLSHSQGFSVALRAFYFSCFFPLARFSPDNHPNILFLPLLPWCHHQRTTILLRHSLSRPHAAPSSSTKDTASTTTAIPSQFPFFSFTASTAAAQAQVEETNRQPPRLARPEKYGPVKKQHQRQRQNE